MGNIIVDDKRRSTMRDRLGKACNLIDDERWLPMFRNRQIYHKKEFEFLANYYLKKGGSASRKCFAKAWSSSRLHETISIVRRMIERAKGAAAESKAQAKKLAEQGRLAIETNVVGRERYERLRADKLQI